MLQSIAKPAIENIKYHQVILFYMADDNLEDEGQENLSPEQIAKMQRENCIFCKIVSGDIPSKKVYDDPNFIGILDINPATEGHVLLIPKQHFQILPQMPQDIVGNLGLACASISAKILKGFKCDGTSIFIANGGVAGQRAPHFMVHIIPRKENDEILLNPTLKELDDSKFNSIKELLFSTAKHTSSSENNKQTSDSASSSVEMNNEEQEDDLQNKTNTIDDGADYLEPEIVTEEYEQYDKNEREESSEDNTKLTGKKKTTSRNISARNSGTDSEPRSKKEQNKKNQSQNSGIDYDKLARMFK